MFVFFANAVVAYLSGQLIDVLLGRVVQLQLRTRHTVRMGAEERQNRIVETFVTFVRLHTLRSRSQRPLDNPV